MTDLDGAEDKVNGWLLPLDGADGPCGPDLEYDNDFLALQQAAAGKPESQFAPAEPPNWRDVLRAAEALFERTRDLRVALLWLRGMLHVHGYAAVPLGLDLVRRLGEAFPADLHPQPDPDDGDPYARVNALTLLADPLGLIGDLREAVLVADRAVGELRGRAAEVALGLAPLREDEADPGRGVLEQMLAAAIDRDPGLRATVVAAAESARALAAWQDDWLAGAGPDLTPLSRFCDGITLLLPPEGAADGDDAAVEAVEGGEGVAGGGARRGLSGGVHSREDAIRAIDMVCDYLERAEPTNPAPLFLRRARQLLSQNFLQLVKTLAPDALPEVARIVGVDPDSVETPQG